MKIMWRARSGASSTDPTASFMWLNGGGVAPAYNVQITADAKHGFGAEGLNDF